MDFTEEELRVLFSAMKLKQTTETEDGFINDNINNDYNLILKKIVAQVKLKKVQGEIIKELTDK